ncbi:hypothetical protein JOC36_001682 [Weissella uvarum]|uniref:hypothetical protein n=1 Tax=Weissella uvarum TaxID=1479233 RepID=UPI001961D549|nr:hypothetical protein [Weissella uvarum]MBM7618082.1 hypothetical protein [Weissella uvarum]MCM0595930.1 hypothetical protein [Weissella uvarum]
MLKDLAVFVTPLHISVLSLVVASFVAYLRFRDRRFRISVPILLRSYEKTMGTAAKNDSKFAVNINNHSSRPTGIYQVSFIGDDDKEYPVTNRHFPDFGQTSNNRFNGFIDGETVKINEEAGKTLKTELPIFNLKPYESKFRFFEVNTIPEKVEVKQIKFMTTRRKRPMFLNVDQHLISASEWKQVRH